ncbi:hypothetical protein C2W62_00690 [Candidatus Entotheonella serta]|nr:hypothetical protein C2W62_00690 [Candidatus Entotheonella serta]
MFRGKTGKFFAGNRLTFQRLNDEDSPRTEPEDWTTAVVHQGLPLPRKRTQPASRLDSDVLAWFKAQGPGYLTRINAVLEAYKEAHEKTEAKA